MGSISLRAPDCPLSRDSCETEVNSILGHRGGTDPSCALSHFCSGRLVSWKRVLSVLRQRLATLHRMPLPAVAPVLHRWPRALPLWAQRGSIPASVPAWPTAQGCDSGARSHPAVSFWPEVTSCSSGSSAPTQHSPGLTPGPGHLSVPAPCPPSCDLSAALVKLLLGEGAKVQIT